MVNSNKFSRTLLTLVICRSFLLMVSTTEVIVEEEDVPPINKESYQAREIIGKTPIELVELRGFKAENHYAPTKDGYFVNVVRIINPKIKSKTLKRPIIFDHGFALSATFWLINSRGVVPRPHKLDCSLSLDGYNGTEFVNGPLMLANHGYDVWLMSVRGTDWSLRHKTMSPKNPKFWDYSLDDFALVDVPTVINYVRKMTKSRKVGFIGHSQATFSIFALLSTRPHYADIVEPIIALAPIAFLDHTTSFARILLLSSLVGPDKDKQGPYPDDARKARETLSKFCGDEEKKLIHTACEFIWILASGKGKNWLDGYFSQVPNYSSLKVFRHYGQLIANKRFMMYDYGEEANMRLYGSFESPSYPIEMIRSRSISLISTKSDTLSHPEDVQHFRDMLTVPLFKDIFIDKDFNHFDLITDQDAREYVFKPILEIFESFEIQSGICKRQDESELGGKFSKDIGSDAQGY